MKLLRNVQLKAVIAEQERCAEFDKPLAKARETYFAQSSHLAGLYAEVDKLTKGKSLLSITDMLLDLVNTQISDTKGLIYGDTYIDRLKEFVSAGDNPTYPDALLALRVLQGALARFNSMLNVEIAKCAEIALELNTIRAALEIELEKFEREDQDEAAEEVKEEGSSDNDDTADEYEAGENDYEEDEADEEFANLVRKEEITSKLDGADVAETWFCEDEEGEDDQIFNFSKLDGSGIPRYDPPAEGITFIRNNM
jgi:hypothetical protein